MNRPFKRPSLLAYTFLSSRCALTGARLYLRMFSFAYYVAMARHARAYRQREIARLAWYASRSAAREDAFMRCHMIAEESAGDADAAQAALVRAARRFA